MEQIKTTAPTFILTVDCIGYFYHTFILYVVRADGIHRTVEYIAMRHNEEDFKAEIHKCRVKYNIFSTNIHKH